MNRQLHWLTVLSTVKDLTVIGIVITVMFHLPYYYERITHSYTNRANRSTDIHYGVKSARSVYTTGASNNTRP